MIKPYMGNAFECAGNFLTEARSEAYIKYTERVLQVKNGLHAKRTIQEQALLALERFGA